MAKGKGGNGGDDTFERKTFSVSRLAEFATLDELTKQTGQPPENWVLVVVKELVDNALDEAERAGSRRSSRSSSKRIPSPSPTKAGASLPPPSRR